MAAEHPDDQAIKAYFEEPYRFDFYQAVKLLERLERRRHAGTDKAVHPPGASTDPEEESVRFSAHASLAFHASDLHRIDPSPKDGLQPMIQANFLSLAGARGPLPLWFTDLIRDRIRRSDHALKAFLDIINNRLISLWYRIRQHHRPTLHTLAPETHPFAKYLLSFMGLRTEQAQAAFNVHPNPRLEGTRGLEARDIIYYAGLFWQHDRSMHGLERMLSHFFRIPFKGQQMCGRWINLRPEDRTMLTVGKQHNALGQSSVIGQRIYDPQSRFALTAGPLDWDDFVDFLPIGDRFEALHKLTNFYTRSAYDYAIDVTVKPETLTDNRPALGDDTLRLGWTSWALSSEPKPDREIRVRFGANFLEADDQPFHVVAMQNSPTALPVDLDLLSPAVLSQFKAHVDGFTKADCAVPFSSEHALIERLEAGEIPARVRLLVACRADGPPSEALIDLLRRLRAAAGPRPIVVAMLRRPGLYSWSLPVPAEVQRWRRVLRAELQDRLLTIVGLEMPFVHNRRAA